jgi:Ca2+/Na+ antiporter
MNKELISILRRLAISIAIAVCAMTFSFFTTWLGGFAISGVINPSNHSHNDYACSCDEPPVLTETQAIICGLCVFIASVFAIWFITRELKFSKWERITALAIYAAISYSPITTAIEILSEHVTC